jgi:Plant transposon protein
MGDAMDIISTDDESSDGDSAFIIQVAGLFAMLELELMAEDSGSNRARRKERQSTCTRRSFDHYGAYNNIQRDHLGPDPLFGKEFPLFFRLSRPRVELIIQQLGNNDVSFYKTFRTNRFGLVGPSIEAKVLLPIKVLAYGVAPHAFADYFQMSVTQGWRCCRMFYRLIPILFGEEFNRSPTTQDLVAINQLHRRVHGVDGMVGSLDCMHTYWKNCPVAWQQSYKGKESGPTIVLEAIADYNLWFWHTSYGYAGAMNDLNILNLSPLLESITNGTFAKLEGEAGMVPFLIDGQQFTRMYFLVDGIYPKYSRFVRGFKEAITEEETRYTGWQEGARKDIERAFGVLQCKWKAIAFPMQGINLHGIGDMVTTCLILHNMGVSDRVMGDVNKRYVASTHAIPEHASDIVDATTFPTGIANVNQPQVAAVTTCARFDEVLAQTVANNKEWKSLNDPVEWGRLQKALINSKGSISTY